MQRGDAEPPPARLRARFTLRLQSLQRGTFDSKGGEYEWVRLNGKSVTRKQFVL